MDRKDVIDLIFKIAKEKNAFETLERECAVLEPSRLPKLLLQCGVLPELFGHDSSEEKLWAKYSDILLAKALSQLGLKSQVIRMRGDSADVLAESPTYKIVGDAKTFRLSRTAKNQKDFKIDALDSWRRENDYAVLVGPDNQFPSNNSVIYKQAIDRNVTLLTYMHLGFLLTNIPSGHRVNYEPLWKVGCSLRGSAGNVRSARHYWDKLDERILELCGKTRHDFAKARKLDWEWTQRCGMEGIEYWETKANEYRSLSRKEAIQRLLRAEKIESKIEQIKKAIGWEVRE